MNEGEFKDEAEKFDWCQTEFEKLIRLIDPKRKSTWAPDVASIMFDAQVIEKTKKKTKKKTKRKAKKKTKKKAKKKAKKKTTSDAKRRLSSPLGEVLAHLLRDGSEERLKEFFNQLLKLKRAADNLPPREAFAWLALQDYEVEVGRWPNKMELRKFMEARREAYRDQPAPDGPWTRLWDESGLNDFWENLEADKT